MILGWSEYPWNPRILRRRGDKLHLSQDDLGMVVVSQKSQDIQTGGELCPVRVDPGMILGWSKYPKNPKILRRRGGKLSLSQDDLGMVEVSQESQDTWVGSCIHPEMIPG